MNLVSFSRPFFLTFLLTSLSFILPAQWVQRGSDIIGQSVNDNCGRSISMSEDGLRVAMGSHFHKNALANAGQVRVFAYSGGGAPINNQAGNAGGAVRVYEMGGVGIRDQSFVTNLVVYPNPATSSVSIENNSLNFDMIELLTMRGDQVLVRSTSNQIDLNNVASGIYLIRATSDEFTYVSEILVQ